MDDNAKKVYEQEFLDDLQEYEAERELEKKAKNVIAGFVASTTATGAIPLPFADAPLLVGQQAAMMAAINQVYGIQMGEEALKSLAAAVIGAGGVTVAGKTIATNLIKMIPGPGTVVGGAVSAGTAGALTYALGSAYIDVCKQIKGGKLSMDGIKTALKRAFRHEMKNTKK